MVFGAMYARRVLPQAMQKGSTASCTPVFGAWQSQLAPRFIATMRSQPVAFRTVLPTTANSGSVMASAMTSPARNYGTRSFWNVSSGKWRLFGSFAVWIFIAAFVEEFVGPYILFHD
mmetsp:Transcript_17705/g.41054  ORF Transcript_17705/g.41054 Transcript_17705/m.41054 type:complete len:117 (-) Transcript_17705:97-447(-)